MENVKKAVDNLNNALVFLARAQIAGWESTAMSDAIKYLQDLHAEAKALLPKEEEKKEDAKQS